MKTRTPFLALVLALALSLSIVQPAFAAFGLDSSLVGGEVGDEVNFETISMDLVADTVAGKYKLISTADVKKLVDKKADVIIIDTMPADWFAQRHIPGAINAFAPLKNEKYTSADKKNLLDQVKKLCGTKTVTKKVKVKANNKKGYKYVTKKVKEVNKDKKIVVYCGFVKCTRSHMAAEYLVKQGFTNVYRQPGGISAWVDAGYAFEGTAAEVTETPAEGTETETPATN